MLKILSAKDKLGFVDGSIVEPDDIDNFNKWKRADDLVQSWIHHCVMPEIKFSILYLSTARDVWLDLKERFSQTSAPKLFQLKQSISYLK